LDLLKFNQDIATIRKLTIATIEGHLVKLIQSKSYVQDILPSDKITELSEAFKHYKKRIAKRYEEQFGDKYSWDNYACSKLAWFSF
jgi:uncharacterized protein YpbB